MPTQEPRQLAGGCACGDIRYDCTATPVRTFSCHCRACQQYTGSAYFPGLHVPADTLRLTRGEPRFYRSRGESGLEVARGFCARCGSPVINYVELLPDIVTIVAASLDDPSWFESGMDIYANSAQPWDFMDPAAPKFRTSPNAKS